jgi:hypothetical protein
MKKNPTQKSFKIKSFFGQKKTKRTVPRTKEFCFWGITPKRKIGIL